MTGYKDSLRLVDVNGDGLLDLITSPFQSPELEVYFGNGDGSFRSPSVYPLGATISGVLVADLNGDNRPDVAVMTNSGAKILLNKGNGTFQESAAPPIAGGSFLGAADFNGDRHTDLMVANGTALHVYKGVGDGTFTPGASYTLPAGAASGAVMDANRDGRPDVLVALTDRAYVLLGNGDGTFRNTQNLQKPLRYVVGSDRQFTNTMTGDFNHDGIPDFAVGPSVYFGNGDGTFRISKLYSVSGFNEIAYDVNNDGSPDLIWVNRTDQPGGYINIALGSAGGLFHAPLETVAPNLYSDPEVNAATQPIVAGDFTRDGIPDIAVPCQGGKLCVFPGTGKSYFDPMIVYPTYFTGPLATGDVNGDGILDMVATNNATSTHNYDAVVFLGTMEGTFAAPETYTLFSKPGAGHFAALVDVNNDHILDLIGGFGIALGKGDGTFQSAKPFLDAFAVQDLAWGDFNRDGFMDLAVNTGGLHVLLGNGSGTFRDIAYTLPSPFSGMDGLAVADTNKDGIPDLLFTTTQPGGQTDLAVILGRGDGTFGTPSAYPYPAHFCCFDGDKVLVADLDRDGITDAIVTEYSFFEYFRGLPGGTFAAPVEYANTQNTENVPPVNTNQFTFLDVNGDGYPDLVAADQFFGVARILNTGLPPGK